MGPNKGIWILMERSFLAPHFSLHPNRTLVDISLERLANPKSRGMDFHFYLSMENYIWDRVFPHDLEIEIHPTPEPGIS